MPATPLRLVWVRAWHPEQDTRGTPMDVGSTVSGVRDVAEALVGAAAEPPAKEGIILGEGTGRTKPSLMSSSYHDSGLCQDHVTQTGVC